MSSTPETVKFTDLAVVLRPSIKVQKTDYLPDGPLPIVDQGAGLIGGFTNEMSARFPSPDPVIVFGDHTCRFKYVPFSFAAGADGTQVFRGREGIETRYLYYACLALGLEHFGYQRHMKHLKVAEVPVWPLSTQQRIAAILSAYDDLIENNTRRIAILEEMARRLYEEWFLQFRFPEHEHARFIDVEGQSQPSDWAQREVKDIVKRLKNGTVYKQKDVASTGSTMVIDQSRAEYLGFHDHAADHEASAASPIIIFGDHTCKMQIVTIPFSLGPNTIAFNSAASEALYYLYALVQGAVETREYKRHWTELMKGKVLVANADLARRYDDTVRPMFSMMETLREQSRNLRAQRDLLLPKLVSGEIDVSGVEAALEAAE